MDRGDVTVRPEDHVDVTNATNFANPFRDVIRTEPAPNLQTFHSNVMETTNKNQEVTKVNDTKNFTREEETDFNLDKIFEYFLSGNEETTTSRNSTDHDQVSSGISPPTTTTTSRGVTKISNETDDRNALDGEENSIKANEVIVGVGPLKLAGCNIYGRMYRVGKVISELSGPCLECRCTDVGVQCKNLC